MIKYYLHDKWSSLLSPHTLSCHRLPNFCCLLSSLFTAGISYCLLEVTWFCISSPFTSLTFVCLLLPRFGLFLNFIQMERFSFVLLHMPCLPLDLICGACLLRVNIRWLTGAAMFSAEFYGLTSSWRLWPNQEWIHSWVHIWSVVAYGERGYGVMLNWMSLWGIPLGSVVCSHRTSSPLIILSVLQLLWRLWQLCSITCSLPWWHNLPHYSARNSGIQCPQTET